MPRRPAVPPTPRQDSPIPHPFALFLHSCAKERSATPILSIASALFAKTPGCHQEHHQISASGLGPRRASLSPLESALTDELRVLPGFDRSSGSLTPIESTPADAPPV